jgi:hypothetical protein
MVHTQREKIEYPLAILWQEARQAHFLHTLPGYETLAALQKRGELVEQLLAQLNNGQRA